jgi:hypothetical protein
LEVPRFSATRRSAKAERSCGDCVRRREPDRNGDVALACAMRGGQVMTDTERDTPRNAPIDESTYGGSASETGGLYDDSGPTIANPEGDTMSDEEERGERTPEPPAT